MRETILENKSQLYQTVADCLCILMLDYAGPTSSQNKGMYNLGIKVFSLNYFPYLIVI